MVPVRIEASSRILFVSNGGKERKKERMAPGRN